MSSTENSGDKLADALSEEHHTFAKDDELVDILGVKNLKLLENSGESC